MAGQYPTPHINASPEDFAKTVLMPGDPLRAAYIAEHFLENAILVNNVRGIQGYTGYYKGTRVSVMASGMGIPSMGIYSYELFHIFDVDHIIRIGSAGAIQPDIHVRDIVIGMGTSTDSSFAEGFRLPGRLAPVCSYPLLSCCTRTADALGLKYHVGNILSSDHFYNDEEMIPEGLQSVNAWRKVGVMAIEMESAALYMNAARCGKHALSICTVSDHILTGEATTAEERQTSFTDMMTLALETVKNLTSKREN